MIRNRAVKFGVLLFLGFVLFGCVSLPQPEEMKAQVAAYQLPKLPEDGKAIVYVVRPSAYLEDVRLKVFLDNQNPNSEVGSTLGNHYIYFNLVPGEHKILSKGENLAETNVTAKAGDIIFIQQEPAMPILSSVRNKLSVLNDYEGKYHVKNLTKGTIGTITAQAEQEQSAETGGFKGAKVKKSSTSVQTTGSNFHQTATMPAGKTLIYLYRLPAKTGFAVFSSNDSPPPFGIKANGTTLITLARGGYYAYLTEPGQIEFTTFEIGFLAPNSVFSITVDAKAGQVYYLMGRHGKGAFGKANLELVSPEIGSQGVASCTLISSP